MKRKEINREYVERVKDELTLLEMTRLEKPHPMEHGYNLNTHIREARRT